MRKWNKHLLLALCCLVVFSCRKHNEEEEVDVDIPTDYENITDDTLQAGMACIGIDGQDNLYVVWKGCPWTGPYGYDSSDIYFSMKPVGGSWTTPLEISNHMKICHSPSMVVDAWDNVHVVWFTDLNTSTFLYRMRNTNGQWSAIDTIYTGRGEFPYLSADAQGGVHLTWPGMNEVVYMYKPFNGEWESPQFIPTGIGLAGNPANTAIDMYNNVHITIQDGATFSDIWYTVGTSGSGWEDMVNLSSASTQTCWNARLTVDDGGTVHVTWLASSMTENGVYYTYKHSGGQWSTPVCIFDGYGYAEIFADHADRLHLFFAAYDDTTGNEDILYRTGGADGRWSACVNVSNTPSSSGFGLCRNVAIDAAGDLHLIWEEYFDDENNYDILYKKITVYK